MMPWLDFKPTDGVCELGCFNGANARKVSEEYGCTIYGLDISERVVKLAQSFNKTESVDFCVASAESLPFANESFNKMYSISVLEHFINGKRALQEAYRCIKPDGILVLTTDSFGLGEICHGTQNLHRKKYFVTRYYSQAELVHEIESVGFKVIGAEPILRHWLT